MVLFLLRSLFFLIMRQNIFLGVCARRGYYDAGIFLFFLLPLEKRSSHLLAEDLERRIFCWSLVQNFFETVNNGVRRC